MHAERDARERLVLLAGVSLAGTVAVGAWLRLVLAGVPLPLRDFGDLRHLHTHLGYYGALFPLMWAAWSRLGGPSPGPKALGLYALAVAVSAIGFGLSGYGPVAIAGSTAVLVGWLVSAWALQRSGPGGWLRGVPLGVLLGSSMVPWVAMSASGTQAQEVARSFLGMLLLGALVPSALAVIRARVFPAWGWLLAAGAGALSLGAVGGPHQVALAVVGVLLAVSVLTSTATVELKLSWLGVALPLAAAGLGLLPLTKQVAVAGLHFLVLGPLLGSLWPRRLPAILRWVELSLVSLMCLAILLQDLAWHPYLPTLAAVAGCGVALIWLIKVGVTGGERAGLPAAADPTEKPPPKRGF